VTGSTDNQIYTASVFKAEAPFASYRLLVSYAGAPTAVTDTPAATRFVGVHPNPFNPQTTITFALEKPQKTEVAVYDLDGKLIAVLASRTFPAGSHAVVWNGRDAGGNSLSSGTYLVRLKTGAGIEARKAMLLK
jgi:flagellar hook assembly protein FlgD